MKKMFSNFAVVVAATLVVTVGFAVKVLASFAAVMTVVFVVNTLHGG